jgi:hypothetical protein
MCLRSGNKDTLYRIHGTNEPWTIGTNVSSGCIRLTNEDIVDLYNRVRQSIASRNGPIGIRPRKCWRASRSCASTWCSCKVASAWPGLGRASFEACDSASKMRVNARDDHFDAQFGKPSKILRRLFSVPAEC